MRKQIPWALLVIVAGVSWISYAAFTDVNTAKYWGKTGLKELTETLDANFALIEAGQGVSAQSLTVTNGQALSHTSDWVICTPSQASTCTVANASVVGQSVTYLNGGSYDIVFVNDNSTLAIGNSGVTLGTNDTVTLRAKTLTMWIKTGAADNN